MTRDSLVAINITQFDKLLNNSTVPLLFYWNGESDIISSLKEDESFISFIKERCMNIDNYTKCKISYFFFKYNEDNEEYNQQIDDIQDVFQIDSNKILILEYLTTIFKKMYNDFLKTRYSGDIMFNTDDTVLEIYSRIQEKFPNRFVKESVLNYVRSELKKKYGLVTAICMVVGIVVGSGVFFKAEAYGEFPSWFSS